MIIHILQHQEEENEGYIKTWAESKGFLISRTLLYRNQKLPERDDFDALVIMGGAMNVYEEDKYPFLALEKPFIAGAIRAGKKVLGICLGSQLLSVAAGGKVIKNDRDEIGWFPVRLTGKGASSKIFEGLPEDFMTFHWHGDTFSIPQGALYLAKSPACANQAFSLGTNVLALQFHPEITAESLEGFNSAAGTGVKPGPSVQTMDEIMKGGSHISGNNIIMGKILDNFLL